jgi:hypothetical protein
VSFAVLDRSLLSSVLPVGSGSDEDMIEWTADDAEKAGRQGWGLFEANGSEERAGTIVNGEAYGDRPYELQCIDESDVFTTDDEAWRFVSESAVEGNVFAKKALEFLEQHSPREYDAIIAGH